jgi:hypothetical protein
MPSFVMLFLITSYFLANSCHYFIRCLENQYSIFGDLVSTGIPDSIASTRSRKNQKSSVISRRTANN